MTIMGSITRTTPGHGVPANGVPAQGDPEWRISDGLTQYPDALALMRERVAAIRAGTAGAAGAGGGLSWKNFCITS